MARWPTQPARRRRRSPPRRRTQVAHAEVARDHVLVVRLHGVRGEAVHLGGLDAGVLEGGDDHLGGERLLGGLEPLREGGLRNASDGGDVLQHGAQHTRCGPRNGSIPAGDRPILSGVPGCEGPSHADRRAPATRWLERRRRPGRRAALVAAPAPARARPVVGTRRGSAGLGRRPRPDAGPLADARDHRRAARRAGRSGLGRPQPRAGAGAAAARLRRARLRGDLVPVGAPPGAHHLAGGGEARRLCRGGRHLLVGLPGRRRPGRAHAPVADVPGVRALHRRGRAAERPAPAAVRGHLRRAGAGRGLALRAGHRRRQPAGQGLCAAPRLRPRVAARALRDPALRQPRSRSPRRRADARSAGSRCATA